MTTRARWNPRSMPLLLLVVVALGAGVLAALAARRYPGRAARPITPTLEVARRTGRWLRVHPRLRRALAARLNAEQASGLALTLAVVVTLSGGVVLAVLAVLVRRTHDLAGIDSAVADWGDHHASDTSTDGLRLVTTLGETWLVVVAAVVVALVEIIRTRNRWVVPFLLVVVAGDKLLTTAVKDIVDRARPALNPIAETLGPSFPSGHSSTAAAFWAAAALVVGRRVSQRGHAALVGVAVGIAVAVAASRVLLDVHWLTDVVGGLALGWAWFAACAVAFGGLLLHFGAAAEVARVAATSDRAEARASRAPGAAPGS